MSDGIFDDTNDIVGLLTERIEAQFGMTVDQLKKAVAAAPAANPDASSVVTWYGLLVEAQTELDDAENDLLAALETQPSEVDDPTMRLAGRVNRAVTLRDGRALVVRWILDPNAPGREDPAAARWAAIRARTGPALQTSAPPRPAASPAPGTGAARSVR